MVEERKGELKGIEEIELKTFENAYHFYRNQVKSFGPKNDEFNLLKQFIKSKYNVNCLIQFMDFRKNSAGEDLK